MSKQLALVHELVDNLLRAADENRPLGARALCIELTRDFPGEVSARRVFTEISAVMRVKFIKGCLRILRHVDMGGYSDF